MKIAGVSWFLAALMLLPLITTAWAVIPKKCRSEDEIEDPTAAQKIAPRLAQLMAHFGCEMLYSRRVNVFDNMIAEFACSDFRLRVARDRGDLLTHVTSLNDEDWIALHRVLMFVDSSHSADWFGAPPSDDRLAESLAKNYDKVSFVMSTDRELSGLAAFDKQLSDAAAAEMLKQCEDA